MKKLLLVLLSLMTVTAFGASINDHNYLYTGAKFNDGAVNPNSLRIGTVYHDASIGASTDLTGAVIAARAVEICAQTAAIHILWSAAATAADGDDHLIPLNTCKVFVVDPALARLTVIEEGAASAEVYLTVLK